MEAVVTVQVRRSKNLKKGPGRGDRENAIEKWFRSKIHTTQGCAGPDMGKEEEGVIPHQPGKLAITGC